MNDKLSNLSLKLYNLFKASGSVDSASFEKEMSASGITVLTPLSKFDNLDNGLDRKWNDKILLVDGYNLFIRGWAADPTLNNNGVHVGGITGFLRMLASSVKNIKPTRIIVVFDGKGGSLRRRKIYPEYKNHSNPKIRLNRSYVESIDIKNEHELCQIQLIRLIEYLNALPLDIIAIDHVEADDVIAYCALKLFEKSKIYIHSTDKDYFQLVQDNDRINVIGYKKIYNSYEILKEYNIHPVNFIIYRSITGDPSDNISGVKGIKEKNILKMFPFLSMPEKVSLDQIFEVAKKNYDGKMISFRKVLDNEKLIRRNFDLMQLTDSIISDYSQITIRDLLFDKTNRKKFNRFKIFSLVRDDGLTKIFTENDWLTDSFRSLDNIEII